VSVVVKRSVTIRGHRTSFSLEEPFFEALAEIASRRAMSLAALVAEVDDARPKDANLSSALRVFVLEDVRAGGRSVTGPDPLTAPAHRS
jgi:predicted DNA-binding ribbon-helix-helix protein